MTPDQEAEAWSELRVLATNVLGFHALVENEDISLSQVKRVEYEAQVYASGVDLALKLLRLSRDA